MRNEETRPGQGAGSKMTGGQRVEVDTTRRCTCDQPERWLPVPGFEGLYEASSHGSIRSLQRTARVRGGALRTVPGRVLAATGGRGRAGRYPTVALCIDGVRFDRSVHVLIALTFIGPRPAGQVVRHADDIGSHLCDGNLSYGTQAENVADMHRNRTGRAA